MNGRGHALNGELREKWTAAARMVLPKAREMLEYHERCIEKGDLDSIEAAAWWRDLIAAYEVALVEVEE